MVILLAKQLKIGILNHNHIPMFIEQSLKYKNPFWMYLLGSFVIIIFNFIGQVPLIMVMTEQGISGMDPNQDPMELIKGIEKNTQLFLLLIPFVVSFLGLWLIVRKLHERSLLSVTTSRKQIDWQRIFFAFLFWGGITMTLIGVDYFTSPENYQWNFKPIPFLIMLVIAVALVPIQTSLEEYIFRGYLMQGFGRLFRNRWAPLLMTSVIFGMLHIGNPEVAKLGYGIMAYYIGTGLFFGILTLMDEGMELALGFHAANNLVTVIFVTATWTAFETESLLIDISEPNLTTELFLGLGVLYPLSLFVMSRKYGWKQWKEKLTGKLNEPTES